MCMHWLKCVRLNRKDRLKNMRATALEVAMLADVIGAYSSIYMCDWSLVKLNVRATQNTLFPTHGFTHIFHIKKSQLVKIF